MVLLNENKEMKSAKIYSILFFFFLYLVFFGTVVKCGVSYPLDIHVEGEILWFVKTLSMVLSGSLFCIFVKLGFIKEGLPLTQTASLIFLGYFHNMMILCSAL